MSHIRDASERWAYGSTVAQVQTIARCHCSHAIYGRPNEGNCLVHLPLDETGLGVHHAVDDQLD